MMPSASRCPLLAVGGRADRAPTTRSGQLALVVAVAPVEVATAHMVRPDVVLETCVLIFFLVLSGSGPEALRDTLSGLALGVATAVKPTGGFPLASFACDRGLRPGRRMLIVSRPRHSPPAETPWLATQSSSATFRRCPDLLS